MIHFFQMPQIKPGRQGALKSSDLVRFQPRAGGRKVGIFFYDIGRIHLLEFAVSMNTAAYARGFQEACHLSVNREHR